MRYPFGGVIRAARGPALASTSVYVYSNAAGTTLATIYAAASGGGALSNPTTTSARGILAVYCESPALWFKVVGDTLVQRLNHYAVGGLVLDALDFGAVGNGVTDDTAALQAMLNAVGTTGARCWVPDGNYVISAPLIIRSNTYLDLSPGATITLKFDSKCNMLNNAAMTPVRSVADAAITTDTTTLTSASASFTTADIGRTVVVTGAGPLDQVLVAEIASRTSATEVELTVAAQTTVSDKACKVHARDSNIMVTGGMWDRQNCTGTGSNNTLHAILLRHLDGITIRDLYYHSDAGKYGIFLASVSDFFVSDINWDCYSDGIHVNGPAHDGTVRNMFGATGDDTVAVMGSDYVAYADTCGDVTDIMVENVHTTLTDANPVKILGGKGYASKRIIVRNVYGTAGIAGVWIGDDVAEARLVGGRVDGIVCDGVFSQLVSGANKNVVFLNATNAGTITLRNVRIDTANALKAVYVAPDSAIARLVIDGLDVANMGASSFAIYINGGVTDLAVSNIALGTMGAGSRFLTIATATLPSLRVSGVSGTLVGYLVHLYAAASVVNRLSISGVIASGGSGLVQAADAASTLGSVTITGCVPTGMTWGVADLNTATTLLLSGCSFLAEGNGIINARSSAELVVRCEACEFGGTATITIANGATFASKSLGFPIDVGTANFGKNANDMAYNTNAARACGAGPVICDGTSWKHLYTGAEYTP